MRVVPAGSEARSNLPESSQSEECFTVASGCALQLKVTRANLGDDACPEGARALKRFVVGDTFAGRVSCFLRVPSASCGSARRGRAELTCVGDVCCRGQPHRARARQPVKSGHATNHGRFRTYLLHCHQKIHLQRSHWSLRSCGHCRHLSFGMLIWGFFALYARLPRFQSPARHIAPVTSHTKIVSKIASPNMTGRYTPDEHEGFTRAASDHSHREEAAAKRAASRMLEVAKRRGAGELQPTVKAGLALACAACACSQGYSIHVAQQSQV
jgi:hypothetical protein